MALRDLAGDRVSITLISPEPEFTYRPMKVAEPFALGHAHSYALADVARDHGARFIHDSVAEIEPGQKVVRCTTGVRVAYDHLVLATGAKAAPAYPHALTFGEDPAERRLHGLLAGVPADDAGFVPVDVHGRVAGLADVYAAGDGTSFPVMWKWWARRTP
jgi:sulfide:quinone oxidoreductase